MHSGVSASQKINQNRLNGNPKTSGSTRSHAATEKHIAAKGINPLRSAPLEGRCILDGYCTARGREDGVAADTGSPQSWSVRTERELYQTTRTWLTHLNSQ